VNNDDGSASRRGRNVQVRPRLNSKVIVRRASYMYNDLGDCDCRCRYCRASFWYVERLKGHSHNRTPEYSLCCGGGRIQMQRPREPPEYIKSLFENKHFMENIRAYNQMFAMTSFGAKVDESINVGRGSYVFKAGYHTELTLKSANGVDKGKRVIMLTYYRYQLYFRLHQYDLLFRGGRLFKQYVVGAFYAVEQNRLDFIRKKKMIFEATTYRGCMLQFLKESEMVMKLEEELFFRCLLQGVHDTSPCIKDDKCSKKFPKKFNQKTFFDVNGHVHYWRRDTGVSITRNEFQLDNSYVVPYNRDLLLAFQAHINVEYRGWSMLIKYLFKYISKAVQILVVHLEDMQRITFRDEDRDELLVLFTREVTEDTEKMENYREMLDDMETTSRLLLMARDIQTKVFEKNIFIARLRD
nr:helitron helicase-like domain-containing protein [Tanacetum cinerariifolium]